MLFDEKYVQDYDIDFPENNTFISGPEDKLMKVAPEKLAYLNADNKSIWVTDPYLFPNFKPQYAAEEMLYKKDLTELLKGTKAEKIVYCCNEVKNKSMYQQIKEELKKDGIILSHNKKLERCHDRFWYCPETEKCICFGTSLNGIGKAICQINELDKEDVKTLKQYLKKAGLK